MKLGVARGGAVGAISFSLFFFSSLIFLFFFMNIFCLESSREIELNLTNANIISKVSELVDDEVLLCGGRDTEGTIR